VRLKAFESDQIRTSAREHLARFSGHTACSLQWKIHALWEPQHVPEVADRGAWFAVPISPAKRTIV